METLLLVRLGPYVELDYSDFLRFHRESAAALTQANHALGAMDLIAVDAKQLRDTKDSFRARLSAMIADRREYRFTGYLNALADPADFRRSEERRVGKECRSRVWVGDVKE